MLIASSDGKKRCFGGGPKQALYAAYHDEEWGKPLHEDQRLFEMLILEGTQAGLTWESVLKKRSAYHQAFYQFNPVKIARMSEQELEKQRNNPQLIRNKLKIYSIRKNARVFLEIQKEFKSFDHYLWRFVQGQPRKNHWQTPNEVPSATPESLALAKDLRSRGMNFVGPTICYAYMQAVGLVNDHLQDCWCYKA